MKNTYFTPLVSTLLVFLLIVVGAWAFLFYKISTNKSEARETLIQIDTEKNKDQSLSSVRSLVSSIKSKIEILDETFIYSDDIAGFVEDLENQAKISRNTLSISNINFDQGSSFKVKPLSAHLDVTGNWNDLLNFVGRIERVPKSVSINRISFSKLGDVQQTKSAWRASFDIKTFVIDPPQQ